MGIFDPRKPGLSNGIAKQEGFPTSGQTSANAGALPAQRAQAPYEQNRAQTNMPQPTTKPPVGGGTLNGGAVQGAQYKTQAQNMNPGVASFVSIPKGISSQPGGGFSVPQPAVPGGTPVQLTQQPQMQFFAGPQGQQSQPQQSQQASPAQPTAPTPQRPVESNRPTMPTAAPGPQMTLAPNQPAQTMQPAVPNQPTSQMVAPLTNGNSQTGAASTPLPSPTTDPANYDYLAEIQKMGQMYDVGGQYDLNQRAIAAEKARQQNMQAWAQNQLAGRGGTATQAQQNYMNTLAALESDTARAQLEQQASQKELSNRLEFNKRVADEKARLVEMGNTLGFNISEEDYNKLAYENVNAYQGGKAASPGSILKGIEDVASGGSPGKIKESVNQKARQVSAILNKNDWNSEQNLVGVFQSMSPQEAKAFYADFSNRSLLQKALDTTWGSDNDKIREVFYKIGVYNL